MTEIEFDPDTHAPLSAHKPTATRAHIEKALVMLATAQRPPIGAGGVNVNASDTLVEFAELTGIPVVPTLMGRGTISDAHDFNVDMVGLANLDRQGRDPSSFGAARSRRRAVPAAPVTSSTRT